MKDTYWRECMFENELIAEMSEDGQIYRFLQDQIFSHLKNLPQDNTGFFFNDTKDRYCAEWSAGYKYLLVNPSKVAEIFGYPIIF